MFVFTSDDVGSFYFAANKHAPVMILVVQPSAVHPIMDAHILDILRAVPTLQLLIGVPDSFMSHLGNNPRRRMAWARRLVRRFWDAAGSKLSQRIRLLPDALSPPRLQQVLKEVDLVLDTFPLGGSLDTLAPALSLGTPVIAMNR